MVLQKDDYGDSIFLSVIGDNPRNRIVKFFLEEPSVDYSVKDVIDETGLNKATAYNYMNELVKHNFLRETRKVSSIQMFALNEKEEKVKLLREIYEKIILRHLRAAIKKQKELESQKQAIKVRTK